MPSETRVLYNAECPVCDAEICHYAAYTSKRDLPVRYDDLNTEAREAWGIDATTAAQRLHVMHNGEIHIGLDAFRILWAQMPRYRPLAWITGIPGLYHLCNWLYDRLLAPTLYRHHLRRQARASDHP